MVLYGSESGSAERGIKKIAKKWEAAGVSVAKIAEGNAVAKQFKELSSSYDFLVVATSSFGEGDPPVNFNRFLLALLKSASAGEKPLTGMQHVRK